MSVDEGRSSILSHHRWMLRLVDVPTALSLRGYPSCLSATLDLHVHDDLFPENTGNWRLKIQSGIPTVIPGGEGKIRLNVRGLATLYSSYCTATELMRTGRLEAVVSSDVEIADQAFAGPPPWMPEIF